MIHDLLRRRGHGRPSRHLLPWLLVVLLVLAACSPAPTPYGSLQVTVVGLASGASITVTGPAGYSATVDSSTVLENLELGDYSLVASSAANFYVTSERSVDVAVIANATTTASFTYSQAFEFTAAADAEMLSLHGGATIEGALSELHPDLTNVEVSLTQPDGWNLSAAGPWPLSTAGTITTTITDDAASIGANEFVFSVTGEIAGQALQHDVPVNVDLLPLVVNTDDDVADPALGSLRWLVENPRVEGHTITFDPALAGGSQVTIELQGQLDIRQSLSIAGFAAPHHRVLLTPASGQSFRLVEVSPTTPAAGPLDVGLSRLEFRGGVAPVNEHGGAIQSDAELVVTDSRFVGNSGRYGGAVRVAGGSFTADEVTFENNVASSWGGAVFGNNGTTIELHASKFTLNHAGNGGAVMVGNGNPAPTGRAELLIVDSDFLENTATSGGGALTSYANATIRNSSFRKNSAADGGGIRNHYRMSIEDDTVVLENDANKYGGVLNDGILAVADSRIDGNTALAGDGGGIYSGWAGGDSLVDDEDLKSLSVVNSRIVNNSASGDGGGIYNVQLLAIVDSTVELNSAGGAGGGGGVYSRSVVGSDPTNRRGTVLVSGSTFNGNVASAGSGGAIAIDVPATAPGTEFVMLNSTVAENSAFVEGGGISLARRGGNFGDDGVFGSIGFSTIAFNTVIDGNGGGVHTRYGDLKLRGAIIASNDAQRVTATDLEMDLYAYADKAVSLGFNWLSTDPQISLQVEPSDVIGQSASLGSLKDNGGSTHTMLPMDAALGDVPVAGCLNVAGEPVTTDQRGLVRPGPDGTCYRGAVQQDSAP